MIDLVIFLAFCVVGCAGFWAGATYGSFKALKKAIKDWFISDVKDEE